MQKAMGYLVAAIWAILLLGGAFRPQGPVAGAAPRPDAGYTAPDFSLQDLSGKQVRLEQFRGQAVFLNFWASWCGPCRLEMPEIERLAADLPPGAAILTVNMTAQESSVDAVRSYMNAHGYTFPVALDLTGAVGEQYRVLSLPTSLFIKPDGTVSARISGPLSRSAMAGYLQSAAGR